MNRGILVVTLASAVFYGTPLVFAALGELLTERSGVLNLGVEGMMLVGAVTGFWTVERLSGPVALVLLAAIVVAALAGMAMALIHAFLVVTLRANQVVSGLGLTIFAGVAGLSSYLGDIGKLGGRPANHAFHAIDVLGLAGTPVLGPVLFHQNVLVYASWILVAAVSFYLFRTRQGLHLRAVGESPAAADSVGINVTRQRYVHTLIGGALAGVGGAFFSLALTPSWLPGMTAGAGWIAVALVIFAFWRPGLTLVGAYFFGALSSVGFNLESRGVNLPPEVFSALPYVLTIIVLAALSSGWAKRRLGAPAALGIPYVREDR
jgi:general nucleoside transport system permease protein